MEVCNRFLYKVQGRSTTREDGGWAGNSCGMGVDLVTVGKESLNLGGEGRVGGRSGGGGRGKEGEGGAPGLLVPAQQPWLLMATHRVPAPVAAGLGGHCGSRSKGAVPAAAPP